jgi:hypothetical protein
MKMIRVLWFPVLLSLLVGCNTPSVTPTLKNVATPTLDIYNLPTTEPVIPTPAAGRVILAAAPDSQQATVAMPGLNELAASRGWQVTVQGDLTPEQVNSDVRVVIFLNVPDNLINFTNGAPGTQFVVLSGTDEPKAGANLSVIRLRAERQAFMAGVVSVLAAPDWRAAGLLPSDPIPGDQLEAAFKNGGGYVCGTCVPFYAPYLKLPYSVRLTPGTEVAAAPEILTQFQQSYLKLVYVSPELASPELLQPFADANFILVGGQTPPESVRLRWATTISYDWVKGLASMWEALGSSQGGQTVDAPLAFTDINEAYFSPGRQTYARQVLDAVEAGTIAILSP